MGLFSVYFTLIYMQFNSLYMFDFLIRIWNMLYQRINACCMPAMWIYLPKMDANISWILHYLFIKLMIFSDITCVCVGQIYMTFYTFFNLYNLLFYFLPSIEIIYFTNCFFSVPLKWHRKFWPPGNKRIFFLPKFYSTIGSSFHFRLFKLLLSWLRNRGSKKAYFYC